MKEYYNLADIMLITGFKKSKSFELINKLNEKLTEEYPELIIMPGRIPIWFWDKKTKPVKENEEEKVN